MNSSAPHNNANTQDNPETEGEVIAVVPKEGVKEIEKIVKLPLFKKYPLFFMLCCASMGYAVPEGVAVSYRFITSDYTTPNKENLAKIFTIISNSTRAGFIKTNIEHEVQQAKTENFKNVNNTLSSIPGMCKVWFTLNPEGEISQGFNDEIYDIIKTAFNNMGMGFRDIDKKFYTEFVVLHETSHCEIKNMNEVFLVEGNAKLQYQVNYYLKDIITAEAKNKTNFTTPYSLLNESFSDAYALTQMLKKYDTSQDIIGFLHRQQANRLMNSVLNEVYNSVITEHSTIYIYDYLTEASTLQKIKTTTSPEQLKHIALEAANYNVNQILGKYFNPAVYEKSYEESIGEYLRGVSRSKFEYKSESEIKNFNLIEETAYLAREKRANIEISPKNTNTWAEKEIIQKVNQEDFNVTMRSYQEYIGAYNKLPQYKNISTSFVKVDIQESDSYSDKLQRLRKNFKLKEENLPALVANLNAVKMLEKEKNINTVSEISKINEKNLDRNTSKARAKLAY